MDLRDYKIKRYHSLVWKTAKEDTELYFRSDKWAWRGSIISGFASGIYTLYISNFGGSIMDIVLGIIGVGMGTILGWAVFVIVLFVSRGLWETPAKMYRTKQSESFRLSWKDIAISEYAFDKDSGFSVGFQISSDKQVYGRHWSLLNVTAQLLEFTQNGASKKVDDVLLSLLQYVNLGFRASEAILSRAAEKEAGAITVLALARLHDDRAFLVQRNGNKDFEIVKGSTCHIRIKLRGCLANPVNTPLEECDVFCTLFYDGNKIGLKDWKRIPDYEY